MLLTLTNPFVQLPVLMVSEVLRAREVSIIPQPVREVPERGTLGLNIPDYNPGAT